MMSQTGESVGKGKKGLSAQTNVMTVDVVNSLKIQEKGNTNRTTSVKDVGIIGGYTQSQSKMVQRENIKSPAETRDMDKKLPVFICPICNDAYRIKKLAKACRAICWDKKKRAKGFARLG